jgi:hypothetical protein
VMELGLSSICPHHQLPPRSQPVRVTWEHFASRSYLSRGSATRRARSESGRSKRSACVPAGCLIRRDVRSALGDEAGTHMGVGHLHALGQLLAPEESRGDERQHRCKRSVRAAWELHYRHPLHVLLSPAASVIVASGSRRVWAPFCVIAVSGRPLLQGTVAEQRWRNYIDGALR